MYDDNSSSDSDEEISTENNELFKKLDLYQMIIDSINNSVKMPICALDVKKNKMYTLVQKYVDIYCN